MATAKKSQPRNAFVIANNDVVYLWWTVPQKIKNCLGFSIHRIVDGKEEKKALMATVGFGVKTDTRKSPQTTDVWPIQGFNWKDLYAPHNKALQYRIIPMVGTWDNLTPDYTNAITTDKVSRTQQYGKTKIIFNRGLLSTQAFTKGGGKDGITQTEARDMISKPGSVWRKRLSGQMLYNINQFFGRAKADGGGKYYAALYELTDTELIKILTANKGNEIILSNANGSETVNGKATTVDDKTNKDSRANLHKLMKQGKLKVYDRMLGTHIGHNKFVIYADKKGKPQAVLTGSTNWTATGLCGQTNNMVIIDDAKLAQHYMDYWKALKADKKQDATLRDWCAANGADFTINGSTTGVWYSPNTTNKSKPAKNPATPVDMEEVFGLIQNAKTSVLFLVFNPGSPSIIDEIKNTAAGKKLFMRGAISDAKMAKQVTTDIYSVDANKKPDKYKVSNTQVTGVANIPGKFSYWEEELLKLGFATIHDKILVIDPFDKKNCAVVTGSHNLGYKASYTNDENMLIIKGDSAVAQAYATHVLDVVNHFKWRYRLQSKIQGLKTEAAKRKKLEEEWNDLDETDKWMNYFFSKGYYNQYELFLKQS